MGKRSAETRGKGKGSRNTPFQPPVAYELREYEKSTVMVTPGKTHVRTAEAAVEVLRRRGCRKSIMDEDTSDSDEELATPLQDEDWTPHGPTASTSTSKSPTQDVANTDQVWRTMAKSIFIEYGESIGFLIEQVNEKRVCASPGCSGLLVPSKVERTGRGGSMRVEFQCDGCSGGGVAFDASTFVREGRRQIAGHSVALSFILNGYTYEGYNKVLGLGLGIPNFSVTTYYDILKKAYIHIHDTLRTQIERAQADMQAMDPSTVGSWKKAVTSGDGVYHTRGYHSKNMTVLVVDYTKNALLDAVHLCMRGNDSTTAHIPLFEGTAKSAEGYGFEVIWNNLKSAGLDVHVHWQDGDSSSEKSFHSFFPNGKVMYCGGHVGRAHGKQLETLAKVKKFSVDYIKKHSTTEAEYKELEKLRCHCTARHGPKCGCLTPKGQKQMKINHFAALVQSGNDHTLYAKRMQDLGRYHARNIHQWDDGKCDFHGDRRCTCKKCSPTDLKCPGEPYSTSYPLTCPLHSKAYEIECFQRAKRSADVIHPEMGRGHSNFPEARNNVLIRYRSKSISLKRLGYCTWTDIGLLQGNMTWCFHTYGPEYHWIKEVYRKMELPIPEGVVEKAKKANEERMKMLETIKTQKAKDRRIALKVARALEQEQRKRWNKNRPVQHTYGADGEEDCGEDGDEESDSESGDDDEEDELATVLLESTAMPSDTVKNATVVSVSMSRKTCACGGSDHMRRSSKKCPLYKGKQKS